MFNALFEKNKKLYKPITTQADWTAPSYRLCMNMAHESPESFPTETSITRAHGECPPGWNSAALPLGHSPSKCISVSPSCFPASHHCARTHVPVPTLTVLRQLARRLVRKGTLPPAPQLWAVRLRHNVVRRYRKEKLCDYGSLPPDFHMEWPVIPPLLNPSTWEWCSEGSEAGVHLHA